MTSPTSTVKQPDNELLSDEELRDVILNDWLVHDEYCDYSLFDKPCSCIQKNVADNLITVFKSQKEKAK